VTGIPTATVAELNEDYIVKMENVLETYERPYAPQEPVICVDERPVTLHADVGPTSPAKPGREARQDNEYKRCGTANVFCAVEPKAGRHFTFATPDRSAPEFAKVAFELALCYPSARTIHLVLDNLNIQRRKSLTDLLGQEIGSEVWDRFTVHYTPTHGSWPRRAKNPRSNDAAPGNSRLEPPHESRPYQYQLEVRPPRGPTQIQLQKEYCYTVRNLV
jgi:DDE superfamily endonuclease